MKKLLLFAALFTSVVLQAQTLRYLDEVFSNVTVDSNVIYGKNKGYLSGFNATENLLMDVYRPDGDTATSRPVIIFMHAGSFLPPAVTGFPFGRKDDNCMKELCKRYAKRGWVAVSMTYRLGWNPTAPDQETRSKTIINAVFRAMQDVKGCVRYFRSTHADSANKWGIDPNKFVLGGSNSGAYVALAASNLNKPAELLLTKFLDTGGNPFIDTTLTGNFDGFGGSQNLDNFPGISSAFNCVLALGGAVADTSIIEPGETPVLAFQGANEVLTPYNTAVVITSTLQPVVEVSGSGDFMPIVAALGNNTFSPNSFPAGPANVKNGVPTTPIDGLYPFYGQGFEPWNWYATNPSINPTASMPKAMAYIDTIVGYATPRLYRLMIDNNYGEPTGIRNVTESVEMSVYPNPAANELNVVANTLQKPMSSVKLTDLSGRLVKEMNDINGYHTQISVSTLTPGTYVMTVQLTDGLTSSTKVVIE